MAKSKAEIEKEYQEALKVSTSLAGKFNDMIDSIEASQKKVTDKQKEYNNNLKSIIASAQNYEDIEGTIAQLQEVKTSLSNRYFGANAKLLPLKEAEIDAAIKLLEAQQDSLDTINLVDAQAQRLADTLNSGVDSVTNFASSIPVIGGALGSLIKGPAEALKGAFSMAAMKFTTDFATATQAGSGGFMAFAKASIGSIRAIGVALLTGPQAIIFGMLAVIAAAIGKFAQIEGAAKSFRDETGLLNSQTKEMEGNINSVYLETVGLGASMEDVAKAAADFTNEFGGIEQPAANTMKSMMVLSKNFGVSTQDAAKLNKAFQNMGGLSEEVAQSNLESLTHLAKQAGVAPGKVMADIAESAESANGFFRGNVQAMGAAAINAAKLGTSLKKAVEVSRGLLNYQSSVSGEMEASAILGTNLNFSQSRYLAAQGDVVGAQSEMVKQLRNQVDLQNLSIFEQEALEKATGMTLSEMQNMARIQELGLSTEGERGKLLQKALKAGMDISNMSKEEINAATDKLALEEERQGRLEGIGNKLSKIGADLLQAFLPIGESLVAGLEIAMPIISSIGKALGVVFGGVIKMVLPAIKKIFGAFAPLKEVFSSIFGEGSGDGLKKTLDIVGKLIAGPITFGFNLIGGIIRSISNVIGGIVKMIQGDFAGGFKQVIGGLFGLIKSIPLALIETVGDFIYGIGQSIGGAVAKFVQDIKDKIANSAIGRFFGMESSTSEESNESDSNTVSQATANNPILKEKEDLASMAPKTVISELAANSNGSNTDMTEVVSAIRELTNVSSANKDVYMNGKKVTDSVTKLQEKSSINRFGLMGA